MTYIIVKYNTDNAMQLKPSVYHDTIFIRKKYFYQQYLNQDS